MANVSLQPAADGPSTEELIAGVERRPLRRRRQELVDRHAALQLPVHRAAVLPDRVTAELAGQVKDVAYQATTTDFWGSMEAVGGPQTYVLGGAFNCGKAQPGQVAPVSHGAPSALLPRRQHPQHRSRRAPDETLTRSSSARSRPATVDAMTVICQRALADQPAVGGQHAHDQRRHAQPRPHRDRRRRARGRARPPGWPARSVDRRADVIALVARAEAAARASAPAEDAERSACAGGASRRFDARTGRDVTRRCSTRSRPRSGESFGRARSQDDRALRLRRARRHHHLPRHLRRAAAAPRPADRTARAAPARRDQPHVVDLGRAAPPATSPTSTSTALDADVAHATRLGGAPRRPRRRVATTSILPPSAVADLMIYLYWTGAARDAAEGRTVFSKPGGGTRIGERLTEAPLHAAQRPGLPGPGVRAVRDRARVRAPSSRSSTTACPCSAPTGSTTASSPRSGRPGTASTLDRWPDHADDRQPRARGRRRHRHARRHGRAAPSAGCC